MRLSPSTLVRSVRVPIRPRQLGRCSLGAQRSRWSSRTWLTPPLDEPNDQGLNGRWREQLELGRRHSVWFDLAALPIYATLRTTLTQLYRPTIVKLWTQLEPVGCSGAQMYRGS